jgi:type I restriction enzyme S subunit
MFGEPETNPMGWEVGTIENICAKITDGEHVTPKRVENGIYLLSARNILNHTISVDDVDYIDENEYARIAKRIVPTEGDILISCSGSVGRVAQIPQNFKCQMVRSVAILQLDKAAANPTYVEYFIETDYLQRQIQRSINQSSQANLFQGKIKLLAIPLPSLDLQNRFADFVRQVDKSKFEIQQGLEKLELQYNALMQRYFG